MKDIISITDEAALQIKNILLNGPKNLEGIF